MTPYEYVKAWRARPENKAKRAEEARRWRSRHPETSLAIKRRHRAANITKIRKRDRLAQAAYRQTPEYKAASARRKREFDARRKQHQESIAGRPAPANCELCGESAITRFDHCHASGNFRGWLCDRCNRTLGSVKDSIPLLLKLAEYLRNGGIPNG